MNQMMNALTRCLQRFENFEKAFEVFQRRVDEYQQNTEEEVYQMALVQAFEMIIELCWKLLKDHLEATGYRSASSPKQIMRLATQAKIIQQPEVWMQALDNRNQTVHTYDADLLHEQMDFIIKKFHALVQDFYHTMQHEIRLHA